MSMVQSVIMGLIQGLTEFLPVSSSGHLALFKILFNVNTDTGLLFDIMLHVGTLLAVCIVYYKDIFHLVKEFIGIVIDCIYNLTVLIGKNGDGVYRHVVYNGYRKFVMLVIVSTIPTGILGFVASDLVTAASEILFVPGICLIITAGLLFIMSIPAILGAMVLQLKDIGSAAIGSSQLGIYAVGMLVAAVVGYICIKTMLVIVKKRKFTYFSIYCLVVGILSIIGYFVTA